MARLCRGGRAVCPTDRFHRRCAWRDNCTACGQTGAISEPAEGDRLWHERRHGFGGEIRPGRVCVTREPAADLGDLAVPDGDLAVVRDLGVASGTRTSGRREKTRLEQVARGEIGVRNRVLQGVEVALVKRVALVELTLCALGTLPDLDQRGRGDARRNARTIKVTASSRRVKPPGERPATETSRATTPRPALPFRRS